MAWWGWRGQQALPERGPRGLLPPRPLTIYNPASTMRLVSIELVEEAAAEVARRYLGVQGAIEVRNRLILEALREGIPQAELSAAAGLSQQRISQLIYEQNGDDNESH